MYPFLVGYDLPIVKIHAYPLRLYLVVHFHYSRQRRRTSSGTSRPSIDDAPRFPHPRFLPTRERLEDLVLEAIRLCVNVLQFFAAPVVIPALLDVFQPKSKPVVLFPAVALVWNVGHVDLLGVMSKDENV